MLKLRNVVIAYRVSFIFLLLSGVLPFIPILIYGKSARIETPELLRISFLPLFLFFSGAWVFVRGLFPIVRDRVENAAAEEVKWNWMIVAVHWAIAGMFWYFSYKLFSSSL